VVQVKICGICDAAGAAAAVEAGADLIGFHFCSSQRRVTPEEAKAIVDRIKIAAYNAEEWLLDRLVMHYQNPHDQRDLLRSFAELSGEIDTQDSKVIVTLDPPDTPLHRRVLCDLIQDLNRHGATFPGTRPFHELPNVLMTPHCSGFTEGTAERRWGDLASNLDRFVRGEPLHNVVMRT